MINICKRHFNLDKSKVDKSPQNVGTMRGDILHKYNVGLPGVKPRLRTWVRKCGRLVKSNLGNGRQIQVWGG